MTLTRIVSLFMLIMVSFSASTVGQDPSNMQRPRRIYPPDIDGYSSGSRAIEMYDADGDHALSGKELDKCPGLKAAVEKVDADKDGKITPQEITDRIHAWQKSKVGLTSFAFQIKHKGKPLVGADVKFVPEKFLGNGIKTAKGTTNKNGITMVSIPGSRLRGLALGMYRVEITKEGEKIPAKYNTKTILGREISHDADDWQEEIVFDLDY